MSNVIQVGQLRADPLKNYIKSSFEIDTQSGKIFSPDQPFEAGTIYYISGIPVKGNQNSYTHIYLSDGAMKQSIKTIPFIKEETKTIDIAFVPKNTCKTIYIKKSNDADGIEAKKTITINTLANILPVDGNTIQKLGFQAAPGFTFVLNGELIRVGKSGTYSISDINVKTLGVVGNATANPDNPIPFNEDSNYFLMDYQYVKEV